jgi:endo-1,3-1,4-beta-glycanase ExoK
MGSERALAAAIATGFMLATVSGEAETPEQESPPVNTGRQSDGAFIIDFSKGFNKETHRLADWDIKADWLGVAYRDENVAFDQLGMKLMSKRDANPVSTHSSAEFQQNGFYGYGRYEVVMRASNAKGAVSSFFLYTGGDMGDPHDEIDIEIVGKSPRRLHINMYKDGDASPFDIDLWFDASAEEHLYAFEWLPGSLAWYVDGVEMHRVTTPAARIPTTTGRVMVSVWAANRLTANWVGEADFTTANAYYRCMSHVPAGQAAPQCSDTFKPPPRA